MSRQVWPDSPVYSCLLWLWTKALGTSRDLASDFVRASHAGSGLPALSGGTRAIRARHCDDCRDHLLSSSDYHFRVAIDVRPYAFAALAVNATILVLVHLRRNNTNWMAALFGLLAAGIVEFQLLFASILPALAICFVALKLGSPQVLWRQLSVALVTFTVALLPTIPRLKYMVHTSGTHVFSRAPRLG